MKIIYAIIFLMLFSLVIQAKGNLSLSLNDCITLALKNSPLVKIENFNVREKRALYQEEQAKIFPQIELNGNFQRMLGYNNSSASVDMSLDLQKILLGYGVPEKFGFESAKWRRERVKAFLVYSVKSAYFDLTLAQEEYKVTEKTFESIKHNRAVAEALVKSGVKLKSAVIRIDAQMEKIKADLLSRRSQLKEAKINLLKFIGLPISTSIEIKGYQMSLPSLPDSSAIIQQVLTHSPELKILEYEHNAIHSRLIFSEGFFLPKLSLGIGYNQDRSPGGDGNYQDYHILVSLPVFGFGENIHKIQHMRASEEKINWQIKEKKNELTARIITLYEKAKITREKYCAYKKASEDINKTLKIAEIEYKSGIISESDLLDIERNTLEMGVKENGSFYEYVLLLSQIEYLEGGTK